MKQINFTLITLFGILLFPMTSSAQWMRNFGECIINKTLESPHGGFYSVGYESNSPGATQHGLLIKTDSLGIEEWRKSYSIPEHRLSFNNFIIDNDDNLILAGQSKSDSSSTSYMYNSNVYKVDPQGNEIWNKVYLPKIGLYNTDICESKNEDKYVITNSSYESSFREITFLSINHEGDLINNYQIEYEVFNFHEAPPQIEPIEDGYIYAGDQDIIRFDEDLNIIWEQEIFSFFHDLIITDNNEIIATGFGIYDLSGAGGSVYRFDLNGDQLWQTTFYPDSPVGFSNAVEIANGQIRLSYFAANNALTPVILSREFHLLTFSSDGTILEDRMLPLNNLTSRVDMIYSTNEDLIYTILVLCNKN